MSKCKNPKCTCVNCKCGPNCRCGEGNKPTNNNCTNPKCTCVDCKCNPCNCGE
jgi:hypothetical protein